MIHGVVIASTHHLPLISFISTTYPRNSRYASRDFEERIAQIAVADVRIIGHRASFYILYRTGALISSYDVATMLLPLVGGRGEKNVSCFRLRLGERLAPASREIGKAAAIGVQIFHRWIKVDDGS